MPFPADFETLADTRLFIKPGRGTDNTEAAMETYMTSGAEEFTVTSVGAIEGRDYGTAELDIVSAGQTRRKLGTYALVNQDWGILDDGAGGAYEAAIDAMRDKTICTFAAVRQSGAVLYFTAQVMNVSEGGGDSNTALTYTMTLLPQTEPFRATTPVVPGDTP